jgi:hypothetical protein
VGDQTIAEYNGNNLFNQYTIGAGEIVTAEINNEGGKFYYNDALGSTTALSNNSSLTSKTE